MRLYAVTDRAWLRGRTLGQMVEDCLKGGATFVQLREKEKLPQWLMKITANEARRLCQRRSRTVPLEDLPAEPAAPERETGDGALWQAVQSLPRDQREAVVLFYYEDLPTEEIARILGTTPGAVRVRLSRAREKLRSILKEGDHG